MVQTIGTEAPATGTRYGRATSGVIKAKGVHHMAWVTNRMDETVRFYTQVLQFPLVVTLQLPETDPFPGAVWGNLGGAKHYFFDIGNGDRIAFFEFHEQLPPSYAEMGAGNHIAINVETEEDLQAARQRLIENGIPIKHDLDHGFCHSIYFDDPVNGINMEFAVWQAPCTPEEPFLQDWNPTPAALDHLGDKQTKHLLHFAVDGQGGDFDTDRGPNG
jgi:catechol 2,3-dioxygenase-like lactoylglutathione lyase family enzyme